MSNSRTLIEATPEELASKILSGIKPILKDLQAENDKPEPFIGVKEAAEVFKVSQNNIRLKCSRNEIPHYQESEKSPIRFRASELYGYILSGKIKTKDEVKKEAQDFVNAKK